MPPTNSNRSYSANAPSRPMAAEFALIAATFKNAGGNYNISPTGWAEVLAGRIVTSSTDRQELARLLKEISIRR